MCGARDQPAQMLERAEFVRHVGRDNIVPHVQAALDRARAIHSQFEGLARKSPVTLRLRVSRLWLLLRSLRVESVLELRRNMETSKEASFVTPRCVEYSTTNFLAARIFWINACGSLGKNNAVSSRRDSRCRARIVAVECIFDDRAMPIRRSLYCDRLARGHVQIPFMRMPPDHQAHFRPALIDGSDVHLVRVLIFIGHHLPGCFRLRTGRVHEGK